MATKAANDPVVITEPRDNHLSSIAQPADQREISKLAYQLWQARGCPEGSPDEDWLEAEGQMQDRSENLLSSCYRWPRWLSKDSFVDICFA